MTESIAPPHKNGPAPRITPGDAQLVAPRRGSRELFPSSWLRNPAKVTYSGGELEGTLLEVLQHGPDHAGQGIQDPGVVGRDPDRGTSRIRR
jgi:hypothetical protein